MEKKRKIEIAALAVVVVLAVGILWVRGCVVGKAAQEAALVDELRSVRMAVSLYYEVNKNYPSSLAALSSEKFTIGGNEKPYLAGIDLDNEGYPIDSFGKRFNYDAGTGRVLAGAEEYQNW